MWDTIVVWWLGTAEPIKAALVGVLGTIVGATIAAMVVFAQIGRQARNAIDQNRRNEATKLKLEQYRALIDLTRIAGDEVSDFSGLIQQFKIDLDMRRGLPASSPRGNPPRARISAYMNRNVAMTNRAIDIITWTERWQIIDPRLDLVRTAVNVGLHDVSQAWLAYFAIASRVMPREIPNTGLLWQELSDPDYAAISGMGDALIDRLLRLGSFYSDFEIEMQNLLLGDLFLHQLSPRQPVDPSHVVIALSNRDQLMRHFEEETAWGRAKAEAHRRVVAELEKLQQSASS